MTDNDWNQTIAAKSSMVFVLLDLQKGIWFARVTL